MRGRPLVMAVLVTLTAAAPAGASSQSDAGCERPVGRPVPGSGRVLHVPDQHRTIAAAVKAARAGDTILIGRGVYHESVEVADGKNRPRDGLRIRGVDRDAVVLDGTPSDDLGEEDPLGFGLRIKSDRVVVENLTLRHYEYEPLAWHGVTGWWGRYLTVHGAGTVGILSAGSRCGQLDHVVAAGGVLAGVSFLGCGDDCATVLTRSVAEGGSLFGVAIVDGGRGVRVGFGTATGDHGNEIRGNRVGVFVANEDLAWLPPRVQDVLPRRLGTPDGGPAIRGNRIAGNQSTVALCLLDDLGCVSRLDGGFNGMGVGLINARGTRVEDNALKGNQRFGIDLAGFQVPAVGNTFRNNTVTGSFAGLYMNNGVGPGNCWSGNDATSVPEHLQTVWSCELDATGPGVAVPGRIYCQRTPGCPALPSAQTTAWDKVAAPADPRAREEAPPDGGAIEGWLPALEAAREAEGAAP